MTEPPIIPGYWMNETGTVLQPAVRKYLAGGTLNAVELATVRSYLRQWMAGDWQGSDVAALRLSIDNVRTTEALRSWLAHALRAGIDPL